MPRAAIARGHSIFRGGSTMRTYADDAAICRVYIDATQHRTARKWYYAISNRVRSKMLHQLELGGLVTMRCVSQQEEIANNDDDGIGRHC